MKYTKSILFSVSNLFSSLKHLASVSVASVVIVFSNTAVAQDSSNGVTENLRYVLSVICGVPF